MARFTEPLSGGVVSGKDPALLTPGQLAAARNCYYVPGKQALTRILGRTAFGVVTATAQNVVGLRDMQFDNGNHYLVAHASSNYLTAAVADTGTFVTVATAVGVGSQLEMTQYRNRLYAFNGAAFDVSLSATAPNSNLAFYLSATATGTALATRQHGMLPVLSKPTITTATGTFSQTATGYYEYWTTEVSQFTQDDAALFMESTFVGDPATIPVLSTATVPTIVRPSLKNPSATTHWRVYRSPKKDREADKKFPSGFMISESAVTTGTDSIADTSVVSNTGFIFPSLYNSGGDHLADWTNASNLGADDGSEATVAGAGIAVPKSHGAYGFAFGGFAGSVKGVEVVVGARVSVGAAPVTLGVALARKRLSNGDMQASYNPTVQAIIGKFLGPQSNNAAKSIQVTGASEAAYTVGGPSDGWFPSNQPPFTDADFGSNFMVVLTLPAVIGKTLAVDYVKVKVYYGATVDSVIQFPTVVYTFGDIAAQVGKNGPPPSASTGDFYQDTLVTNDVTNPGVVKYSYPGDPDAFPATYYVDFETKDNDQVRLIKVVNDRLIVALDRSVWRMNYLPSERDASFDRGKSKESISSSFGCVDPMCACVFSPDGGKEYLAFVSHQGIHATDGYSFDTLTDSQNWRGLISTTATSNAIALVNDPERKMLRFFFRNDSASYGNETYLCLPISYAPEHVVDGKFKVGGLMHMRNFDSGTGTYASLESAWPVPRSDGSYGMYLGYGGTTASATAAGAGKVYFETGSTIPANDPAFQYTTRRMFSAGFGNEWKLGDLYGYVSNQTGTQSFRYTPLTVKTGDATGEVTQTAKSLSVGASQALHKIPFNIGAEGLKLSFSVTAGHDDLAKEFLVIDGEDFGEEDSGR